MKKTNYQKLDDTEKVRRFTIYHPSATSVEIRRETGFSFDYIQKIRKEIDNERASRLLREGNEKLLAAIGELEDIYDELNNDLWQMLGEDLPEGRLKPLSVRQKMQAMKLITELCAKRIKLKFDLGLYNKEMLEDPKKEEDDLGEVKKIIAEYTKKYLHRSIKFKAANVTLKLPERRR